MIKETPSFLKLILALAFITGCTKTRQAELPDDVKENIFAISEFGNLENATFSANKISVDAQLTENSVKALEQSASLSSDDVSVPGRLKFMFDNLPMSGLTSKPFKISFSVDKNYVTSYKNVQSASELTMLERGLAITAKEAQLLTKSSQLNSIELKALNQLQKEATSERKLILAGQKEGVLLVPLFKYRIESYGIIERTKNELKESTSVLSLKKTDFKNATHIQITSQADSRLLVGMSADQMKQVDQLYDEQKMDHLITTAGNLQSKLKIGLGFIDGKARIFTRLDAHVMHIYEMTKISALNEFQLRLLKTNSGNQQILSCKDTSVATFIKSSDADCVLLLKGDLPISYVSSKLTLVDLQGNTSNMIQFAEVPRSQSMGLISIAENTAAVQKDASGTLDPKNALKISDIINKEFFFRRTFEDAPSTSLLMPGLAGDLILAKFVLDDNRIVVQAAEKFINYKNENSNQYEELMSIGATYIKVVKADANGSILTIPTTQPATKYDADYVILDWTNNSLPIVQSPLSMTTYGQCLTGMSNTKVTDVSFKNDSELVLNFTYNYTTVLRQECATYYDTQNYNGGDTGVQQVHTIRERVSFRENKVKKSDEKIVSSQVPFPAQNKMGYGLFTKGLITPSINGNRTQQNGQLDLPIIHDFTDGKKLVYTIGGLADNDPQRQMVIDLTKEVIADWNTSLHLAFKGTTLDRTGNYIEAVVNGESSEKGFLGDTDKNFIWYDDKINEGMSVIGVSQAGSHPRTGTIIADQVVMYLGNSRNYIESTLRAATLAKQYKEMVEKYKKEKIAELAKNDKTAQHEAAPASDSIVNTKKIIQDSIKSQNKKLNNFPVITSKSIAKSTTISETSLNELQKISAVSSVSDAKTAVAKLNLNSKQMPYIKEFFVKILDSGTSFNNSDIDATVAREILKSNSLLMTAQQKSIMKLHVQLAEAKSNLQKIFLTRPGCVTFKDATDSTSKFTNMTFEQALRISLKATLAHEMGHSLGLTHNFMGSSDKANWEFNKESTGRNYSSIMDYQDEARQVYAGPGPYDVYALRAGYTGFVEANDTAAAALTKEKSNLIKTIDGKNFVNVETVKSSVASNSWVNLNKSGALSLLKTYKYCTDKDLRWEADCRQFDLGGSATEIIKNAIADYNERYGISRYGYDRREFGWEAKSRVIGRSFDTMLHIRQYLDEAFYKLIVERGNLSEDQVNDYVAAAISGWIFFQQVLATPDASVGDFLSPDRFSVEKYSYTDDTGKEQSDTAFVEKKLLRDKWSSEDRLGTIGMEEDKIMALQLLTLHGLKFPKYAMHNLAFSYLDLEKYLLGIDEALKMPTVATLEKIITNKLPAFIGTEKASFIPVNTKNEVTEAMRVYAGISSILSLESQSLSEKDNFANLFKVGSTLGSSLKDRVTLSRLDNPANSQAATYFWAPDNSSVTQEILSQISRTRHILSLATDLKKPMKMIAGAILNFSLEGSKAMATATNEAEAKGKTKEEIKKIGVAAYQAKVAELIAGKTKEKISAERKKKISLAEAELLTLLQKVNAQGLIVTAAETQSNPSLAIANQVKFISNFIQTNSSYLLQGLSDLQIRSQLPSLMASNAELGDKFPLFALAQKALIEVTADTSELKQIADSFLDSKIIETNDNMVMKNIEFLNMITVIVNPGYNR